MDAGSGQTGDALAERLALHAVAVAGEAIAGVDADGVIRTWNAAAEELLGMDADEVVGEPARSLAGQAVDVEAARAAIARGVPHRVTTTMWTRTGGTVTVEVMLVALPSQDGRFAGATLLLRDVGARDRERAQLEEWRRRHRERLVVDALTGLPNRRAFDAGLADLLAAAGPEDPVSVVVYDLDDFSTYNDDLGQAAGDEVLGCVADILRERVPDGLLARLADDELAFALPVGAAEAAALGAAVADDLRASRHDVTASWGTATTTGGGLSRDALLVAADADLYARSGHVAADLHAAHATDLLARDGLSLEDGTGADSAGHAAVRDTLARLGRHAGAGITFLVELEGGELVVRVATTPAGDLVDGFRFPDVDDVTGRLAGHREGVFSGSLADHPGLLGRVARTRPGLTDYVAVPIRLGEGRLGAVGYVAEPGRHVDASLCEMAAALVAAQLQRDGASRRSDRVRGEALAAQALLAALGARDAYTGSHSETVVQLARAVARDLGVAGAALRDVERIALLHDIGKLGIPDGILHKAGPLTDAEWEVMRTHPAVGAQIVASIPSLAGLAPAVHAEHERWDGGGYPLGLAGEAIPLAARIILACDAFDAMTTDRPYRAAMPTARAREELRRHRGTQFDPAVVDALERVLNRQSRAAHLARAAGAPA